jgi:exonuclease VII small subunit
MKNENIPADIKSKSLKEARAEIDMILSKLEKKETNLNETIGDYQRLVHLNNHINHLFKKRFIEISKKK